MVSILLQTIHGSSCFFAFEGATDVCSACSAPMSSACFLPHAIAAPEVCRATAGSRGWGQMRRVCRRFLGGVCVHTKPTRQWRGAIPCSGSEVNGAGDNQTVAGRGALVRVPFDVVVGEGARLSPPFLPRSAGSTQLLCVGLLQTQAACAASRTPANTTSRLACSAESKAKLQRLPWKQHMQAREQHGSILARPLTTGLR